MKWLLFVALYSGYGGHIAIEKIKFRTEKLCEHAALAIRANKAHLKLNSKVRQGIVWCLQLDHEEKPVKFPKSKETMVVNK